MERHATFSKNGQYRYLLSRRWGQGQSLRWVMLNPSTADETNDTPTIERVITLTEQAGYDAAIVTNLFAYITPNHRELWKQDDPVGPNNNQILGVAANMAKLNDQFMVVAWGGYAPHNRVAHVVRNMLKDTDLFCLELTMKGAPKHPLSVPATFQGFMPWSLGL